MFDGFNPKSHRADQRRFGLSLAISGALYMSILGSVVAASAAVRHIVKEDILVQVELKRPPPPEPPPPPPEPPKPSKVVSTAPARAKVVRPKLEAPKEIPEERPEESDAELPEAPPVDQGQQGFLTGVAGGTGTGEAAPAPPPPPPPPKVSFKPSAPIREANTTFPEYPRSARRAGIQGTVVARIYVRPNGQVSKVDILSGPDVFHDAVREALLTWRYVPARMQDGTTIADTHIVRIPFKLN